MTKNANFEPNLDIIGTKILIFTGGNKGFGAHETETNIPLISGKNGLRNSFWPLESDFLALQAAF